VTLTPEEVAALGTPMRLLRTAVDRIEKVTAERDWARDTAARLEAQLARVQALHHLAPIPGANYCAECEHDWPCTTSRIVDPDGCDW
jgi:hypothetical protein